MKTAGVGSILSVMCVGFASACSSPVSIGHNDNKATADSGQQGGNGQPLGTGGGGTAWVNMGTSSSGVAGQYGAGGGAGQYGAGGGAGQYGAGGRAYVGGPSFEAQPGAQLAEDAGSGRCEPLDSTGAIVSGGRWIDLEPGMEMNGCSQQVLEAPAEIYAVHSVNSPGLTRSWVNLSQNPPPDGSGQACDPDEPAAFLHTVNAYEQLTIFNAPIHANAGTFITDGFNVINVMDQPLTGDAQVWLLTSPPPSMVPCAVHGAFAAIERGWELDPGQELTEQCMRLTLSYAHEPFLVRVQNGSDGTESILSVGDPTGPGGDEVCNETGDAAIKLAMVKDAGIVEAKPRDVRMMPGQQLILRMRAVNVTDRRRTGTVSVRLY